MLGLHTNKIRSLLLSTTSKSLLNCSKYTTTTSTAPHFTTDGSCDNNQEQQQINIFTGRQDRSTPFKVKKDRFFDSPFQNKSTNNSEEAERWRKYQDERKTSFLDQCNQFYQDNKQTVETSSGPFSFKAKTPVNMLFAYVGTGYHGLEFHMTDQDYPTLENCLERALFLSGMILPTNFGDPSRLNWRRSSRTDKGVHSMSTIIKANLEIDRSRMLTPEKIADYVALINSNLPDALRIISMEMTKKSFDPRRQGIARTYHYVLPKKYLGDRYTLDEINQIILPMFIGNFSYHNFTLKRRTYIRPNETTEDNNNNNNTKELEEEGEEEEIEEEEEIDNNNNNQQQQLNQKQFITNDKYYPKDRNAEMSLFRRNSRNVRRVISFKLEETFQESGQEWVKFVIEGESFIQYQIRKMMGFVLAITNGKTDLKTLELALHSPFSIHAPIAPPNPLYLFDCAFKQKRTAENSPLFHPFQLTNNRVNQFKKDFCSNTLYPHLKQLNDTQQFFETFMDQELPIHKFGVEKEDLDNLFNMYIEFKEADLLRRSKQEKEREEIKLEKEKEKEMEMEIKEN
ncbi:hypothetical protein DFA_00267 [Cavenderia fasciculata]|uniref:Pseudouridine synthase I TruA alpha/beta domain-containing protein n=1 Tax=Cavenderia fasciculata TaxID=261658 RepID=F4PY29_CACFS|nr:uncharacterized protein DFA_00267 [Cavenderia fasciculata]EGG19689.1 hypothetical protein DFA_00267 [Cavenderia fasciculata]|eukprot:XP_004357983.1 hypothetical protein DFA_00267 [Cavenderia fasciculata]